MKHKKHVNHKKAIMKMKTYSKKCIYDKRGNIKVKKMFHLT